MTLKGKRKGRGAIRSERAGPRLALLVADQSITVQRISESMPGFTLGDSVVIVGVADTFAEFRQGLSFVHARDQRRTVEGEQLKREAI